ncbi:ATP-binding protein [Streptomyces sp. PmtG]
MAHTFSDHVLCRVCVDARRLRVEVEDQARGATVPTWCAPDPDREGGRGLALVDALAHDWGVTDAGDGAGQVVWAELSPVARTDGA